MFWTWLSKISPDKIMSFLSNAISFIMGFLAKKKLEKESRLEEQIRENETYIGSVLESATLTNEQLSDSLSELTPGGSGPVVFEPGRPTNSADSNTNQS